MLRIRRSKLIQTISSVRNVFTTYLSVHVRWPGKTGGAFGFALNFWFFWFKPKEQIEFFQYGT